MFTERFNALNKEGQFTKQMLGSGATQIRKANYATKGIYFQAFTSLSTGLERIGKLCLMLDHYGDHNGNFQSSKSVRDIGHNIGDIYAKCISIIAKRSFRFEFLQNLDDPLHQAVLTVLSEFAEGDRYSNINLLVSDKRQKDPIASWAKLVDQPLYDICISQSKKDGIRSRSQMANVLFGQNAMVLHTSEVGTEVSDFEEASYMTGVYEAVAPYRQMYVLQIIRFWVELLTSLQYELMRGPTQDIPFFSEVFAVFYNDDSYFRTRKTWENV